MYASIQYLLAGLPVVSTRSRGGRDVFFDDAYVRIVEDDPDAVAQGVRELIDRDLSAETIRQRTLEKVSEHRDRFIATVQRIYDTEGVARDFAAEWDSIFFNKLVTWQRHDETIRQLEAVSPDPSARRRQPMRADIAAGHGARDRTTGPVAEGADRGR